MIHTLDIIYYFEYTQHEDLQRKKKDFAKGSCKLKRRIPNLKPVQALLNRMQYTKEKVEFMRNYIDGLEKTRETLFSQRSMPNIIGQEDYRQQMSVYLQVYPELLKQAREKLRELEQEHYETTVLTNKF